ncbi:MAG: hypothetical protein KIT27_08485 [Legionellales bacterium]|nr:hypothetical protein [Legionellales bacterium]
MKQLGFDVKRNLKRSPRIYVKTPDLKVTYGSFIADDPSQFEGWDHLNDDQKIELKHYIQNIDAVKNHLGQLVLNEQSDYRFRLPLSFIDAIAELSKIGDDAGININIFDSMLVAIIQELKISISKLSGEHKIKALAILDKLGLAEYKKIDRTQQIQAIYSELLAIRNKSEKLHQKANTLFNKDKSYSPKAIEGMAKGETTPSKWLVACAIDVLAEEKRTVLTKILSNNDIYMLWYKPLVDNGKKILADKLKIKYQFNIDECINSN